MGLKIHHASIFVAWGYSRHGRGSVTWTPALLVGRRHLEYSASLTVGRQAWGQLEAWAIMPHEQVRQPMSIHEVYVRAYVVF